MSLKFKTATAAAVSATALMIASGAMAASVSIDQIGAIWQNATGSASFTIDNGDGDPAVGGETVTIFWGSPAGNDGQSGYSFNPTDVSFTANPDTPYSLGTFTHFNRPIFDTGGDLSTVELNFVFGGTPLGGALVSIPSIFEFTHDETLNTGDVGGCATPPQQSGTPCDDVVTVGALAGPTGEVTVDNTKYIFTLLGFSPDGSAGSFSNTFITEEGLDNSRDLWFSYTATNVVPLPAAGWLLLAGVGGLAAVGRRRKKA